MIAKGLREEGYAVDVAGDGVAAVQRVSKTSRCRDSRPDVADQGGLDVCRELRSTGGGSVSCSLLATPSTTASSASMPAR
jgi:CheY-like chemotaxis protein